jgi:NTP pyrophosphatase (non-canonical NTP hydrolase)
VNFIKLAERQQFINKECGFELNPNGLLLGFYAELGELASAIALYKGWKKPKPSDLKKFGDWSEVGDPDSKYNMYTVDFIFIMSFEKAWNHEITKAALKQEIEDEMADVLVYLLQLELIDDEKFSAYEVIVDKVLAIGRIGDFDVKKSSDYLEKLAKELDINLEKAYFNKTEKLLARFNK